MKIMKTDLADFWNLTRPADGAQLTDELIISAERTLSCPLPKLLIELLKIKNGGKTKGFVFPMTQKTCWADDHIPLDTLFGIIDNSHKGKTNILDSEYLIKEWELPEKQIMLTGDGHWWITLDYRKSDNPNVLWIEPDNESEIILANNFEEFIDKLVPSQNISDK